MSFSSITSYAASGNGRSWQGCASDGSNVWLISDRTTQVVTHVLSNNIETYDRSGTRTATDTAIYTATVGGNMWSFVDGYYNATDGYLYVCCTDFHSNAYVEANAQILVLNPATWAVVTSYTLTTLSGSIESITKRGTEWWVCWSGSQSIRRYNSDFSTLIGTYSLEEHATPFGGADIKWWQGLDWHGDVLFANLHGENETGGTYAPGLEQYWWNGTQFEWMKTHTPPAYGCGQGFCRVPNTNELWFADRPGIAIVKCTIGDIAAKSFNGTTTQIRGGTLTAVDDLASNAMTISAWITPTTTGEGGSGRIANKRNVAYPATDANGGWLFYTTGTATLGWIVASAAGAVIGQQVGNSNSITLSTRQHVLVTYDDAGDLTGDRKAHIYVNGVEVTYATDTATVGTVGTDATGELIIGNVGDATRTFDGLIEDFAIWPSVLNSTKIALLAGGAKASGVDGTYVTAMPNLEVLTTVVGGTAATFDFAPNAIQNTAVLTLTAATFDFATQDISITAATGTTEPLTAAAFDFAANDAQIQNTLNLSAAAFDFVAQDLADHQMLLHLGNGTFNFVAKSIRAGDPLAGSGRATNLMLMGVGN